MNRYNKPQTQVPPSPEQAVRTVRAKSHLISRLPEQAAVWRESLRRPPRVPKTRLNTEQLLIDH
jgi:hypothetical protein